MVMTTFNVTDHAAFIPEVWSDAVVSAAESKLVMANLVNRAYEGDIGAKGDTVKIPNIANLTANDKLVGTSVTVQAPAGTAGTLTINQHKEVSFYVEDVLSAQANPDVRARYSGKAGYALAGAIDTDLLELYSSLSQSSGSGTTAITDDIILNASLALDQADVPPEDRYMVIAPSQKANILKLDKFVKRDYRQDGSILAPVTTGVIGDIYGMPVFVTNQVVVAETVAHNLMFHKDAFTLAIQMAIRFQAQYKLEYLSNLLVGDVVYGVGELQDTYAVDMQTTDVAVTTA